jgi:hypothetical protein
MRTIVVLSGTQAGIAGHDYSSPDLKGGNSFFAERPIVARGIS